VTVSAQAWRIGRTPGSSRMFLNVGDVVSVSQLLEGLMVASGNDAAESLGATVGGSSQQFVAEMHAAAARGTRTAPPERSPDEIAEIAASFGRAAGRARAGGVDGVELHAHETFLHAQFLSPRHNRRADRYGGSLENRMRLIVETLMAMRDAVGPDIPLGVRLKAAEPVPGGLSIDAVAVVIRHIEDRSLAAYIRLTAGDTALYHGPMTPPDGHSLPLVGTLNVRTTLPVLHACLFTVASLAALSEQQLLDRLDKMTDDEAARLLAVGSTVAWAPTTTARSD